MITGVHHVCVKCRPEELEKVQKFYGELLGLPLVRSWGEPNVEGLMYGAGTSLIEISRTRRKICRRVQSAISHWRQTMWTASWRLRARLAML